MVLTPTLSSRRKKRRSTRRCRTSRASSSTRTPRTPLHPQPYTLSTLIPRTLDPKPSTMWRASYSIRTPHTTHHANHSRPSPYTPNPHDSDPLTYSPTPHTFLLHAGYPLRYGRHVHPPTPNLELSRLFSLKPLGLLLNLHGEPYTFTRRTTPTTNLQPPTLHPH